jgi:thioesterase domain-containing protein
MDSQDHIFVARGGSPPTFPCSVAQEQFWFLDQVEPGNPALNVAVRWQLDGCVVPGLMQRAFETVIQRHEILRSSFLSADGEPRQQVMPYVPFKLATFDLTGLGEADRAAEALRIGHVAATTSFDLFEAPLLRATLVRIAATRSLLLVTVHHIVSDGWSIGILAREVGETYRAIAGHRPTSLPDLPVQYCDYALWQKQWLASKALEPQARYWQQKLQGMRYFELLPDRPRSDTPTATGHIVSLLMPRALTDRLATLSRGSGCTLFMTALAALKVLLHRRTGQTDIAVGTQVAGRDLVELEGLVGPFINTLVLRDDLSGDPEFPALLLRVRDTVIDALSNADMPIHHVTALVKLRRDLSRHPLFSVNFIFQRSFITNADYGDYQLTDIPSLSPGAIYDLNFFMVERPDGWRVSCEFNADLFRTDTVTGLLDTYAALLEGIAAEPIRRLSQFDLPEPDRMSDKTGKAAHLDPPVRSTGASDRSGDVQNRVAHIWHEILDVYPASGAANFFELGGHSLLAARMLARVEATFGKRIPLIKLLREPTLEGLVQLLQADEAALTDHQVITIQRHGARPPIFAINNTGLFFPLASRLGQDQPFIALQRYDPGAPEEIKPRTFEEIAADYVRIIRKVRPKGPYMLIGLCVRGALAYEIAQQLVSEGENIALLIMIDTWAPGYLPRLPRLRRIFADLSFRMQVFRTQVAITGHGRNGRLRYIARRVAEKLHLMRRPVEDDDWYHPHLVHALRSYRPKPYTGRVLLLARKDQPKGRFLDADLGWSDLLIGWYRLELLPVVPNARPNDAETVLHLAMFREPGVDVMATHITRAMEDGAEKSAEVPDSRRRDRGTTNADATPAGP